MPSGEGQNGLPEPPRAGRPRTLEIGIRTEPSTIADKPLLRPGVTLTTTRRLFNATLAIFDGDGAARPYLAETLPRLGGEGWRLYPDGRMETTYRLRPNAS